MYINGLTGEVVPENWLEFQEILGISRSTLWHHRQMLGATEFTPENLELLKRSIKFTSKRVGRSHQTLLNFVRRGCPNI